MNTARVGPTGTMIRDAPKLHIESKEVVVMYEV